MEQNLSTRQFFHGTDAHLQPGDMLHPNYKAEGYNKNNPEHSDFVWMTNRKRDADFYARHRTRMSGKAPHVYEVESTGLHGPGPLENSGTTRSNSTHISLAPVRVKREVPEEELVTDRVQIKKRKV